MIPIEGNHKMQIIIPALAANFLLSKDRSFNYSVLYFPHQYSLVVLVLGLKASSPYSLDSKERIQKILEIITWILQCFLGLWLIVSVKISP